MLAVVIRLFGSNNYDLLVSARRTTYALLFIALRVIVIVEFVVKTTMQITRNCTPSVTVLCTRYPSSQYAFLSRPQSANLKLQRSAISDVKCFHRPFVIYVCIYC